ncbi:class A beta-lactamase [Silvibacterium dinghuense]|uniref:beta-lactamase n=1 Tax=Silvibacterium dinghuense TaxID=1560006 RepID=A0A4Q1S8C7_9BACT|nr:class A beta-lactamase [Silvibacterium dinghuense]RXS93242.1 class A beta-lactamase [Silvibacterium dinghuense]GGH04216.1 beta-lactamase [Silvibacterium dinghuense]
MISRRDVVRASLLLTGEALIARSGRLWAQKPDAVAAFEQRLKVIEAGTGGRLGVGFLDPANGIRAGWKQDERFPMCSTFKVLAVSALLSRADRGEEHLDRLIRYGKADVVSYSPESSRHVDTGMTVSDICRAAMTLSDNTAANLILASIGGPAGVTAFARSLGDEVTRLDRTETSLNEAVPGDPRDTTAPGEMVSDLRKVVTGNVLSAASRAQLVAWMEANTTGKARIRAGLAASGRAGSWRIGDKTGTGDHATANDIAVLWPEGRSPVFLCVYLTEAQVKFPDQEAAIAAVAQAAAGLVQPGA